VIDEVVEVSKYCGDSFAPELFDVECTYTNNYLRLPIRVLKVVCDNTCLLSEWEAMAHKHGNTLYVTGQAMGDVYLEGDDGF